MSNIQPLGDRVAVQPIKDKEASASGIILPEGANDEKVTLGNVIATGPDIKGKIDNGDKVVFSEYGFDKIELDGEEYLIMKEEKVLAVIK